MKAGKFVKVAMKITGGLVLTILFFYMGELLMRALDPATELPNGKIGENQYTWSHPVVWNRFGFRDRNLETPKPAGVYRIMVLGDSFVFGTGLAPEERFTNVLESKLNRSFPQRKFEVANFGHEGVCTEAELGFLSKYAPIVQPDLIVVGYVSNDTQCQNRNGFFPPADTKLLSSMLSAFTNAKLYYRGRLFRKAFFNIEEELGRMPSWLGLLNESYATSSPDWRVFLGSLGTIKAISDKRELPPPVFAVLNHSIYLDQPVDYTRPDDKISAYLSAVHQAEAAAAKVGFVTLNYEREIAANFPDGRFTINQFDNHPPAKLHEIYAEKLLGIITEKYLK